MQFIPTLSTEFLRFSMPELYRRRTVLSNWPEADNFSRERLAIEAGQSLTAAEVAAVLDEGLNFNWFLPLKDPREKIEKWRQEYNIIRPHAALGDWTPRQFVEQIRGKSAASTMIRLSKCKQFKDFNKKRYKIDQAA